GRSIAAPHVRTIFAFQLAANLGVRRLAAAFTPASPATKPQFHQLRVPQARSLRLGLGFLFPVAQSLLFTLSREGTVLLGSPFPHPFPGNFFLPFFVYTLRIHSMPLCGGILCSAHLVRRKSPKVPSFAATVAQDNPMWPARALLPASPRPSASCAPVRTRRSAVSVPVLPIISILIPRWFACSGSWLFSTPAPASWPT